MHLQTLSFDKVVDQALTHLDGKIVMALPLGLGKPNRLVNAFYQRARTDSSIELDIVTALSLDIPEPGHWLEARMAGPFLERHFGVDYPRLDYLRDLVDDRLPGNVRLIEFYFQSGDALGDPQRQRHYISSNYTHVARDVVDRGVNLTLQLVAGPVDDRLSLSSNPDVSLELRRRLEEQGDRRYLNIAHVHPDLPFMAGDAVVDPDFFDLVIDTDPAQPLFALPRTPVQAQDHAVGFHASRLVADEGTLQIGIGSLSDALIHSLILRHRDNSRYRSILEELAPEPCALDEHGPFSAGLYGASEMFMDAFMHLYRAGILKREVFDDLELQRRANAGEVLDEAGTGALMDGGFFLGSADFYEFLRTLDESERPRFRMHGVARMNQLYGGNELLEVAQRRHARFINTCMKVTATGAAVSDGLADHQVVSGVGGQYNFVAMAHAMDDGRSILMLRAVRESDGRRQSNIVWEYPHVTIPRHLRDMVVTEYGVADLRGRTDEECIQSMVAIMDAEFQDELVERAKSAGKLARDWQIPAAARRNTPEQIDRVFAPPTFPRWPFGSDFTEVEQRLMPALQQLKSWSRRRLSLMAALARGRPQQFPEELARLGLARPESLRERVYARLLAAALAASARG